MKASFSHQKWSSGPIFILAAVGSAVGLGNIWKFPFTTGVSGGAAFVFIYLLAILGLALPILIGELLIGRRGQQSPPNSIKAIADEGRFSSNWSFVGWLGVVIALIILPLYSMVAGWAMAFVPLMFSEGFQTGGSSAAAAMHTTLITDPVKPALWQGLFMLATAFIVGAGLKGGIERSVKILMPLLFLMLLVMVLFAARFGDFGGAFEFLFSPDFSKINSGVILAAIGQAFFSINIGLGIMITFGAYLQKTINIPKAALIVVVADTMVALIAGLMIFPIVFANGLDPAEGPGLLFVTLPLAFQQITFGEVFGTGFFIMLFFAALTSTITVLEVPVAWAEEKGILGRKASAFLITATTWVFGLLAIFSFSILSEFHPLGFLSAFETSTFFDLMDFFAFNVFLPLSGLAIAFFIGWKIPKKVLAEELSWPSQLLAGTWHFSIKYLCPLAMLALFITNIFS